MKSKIQELNDQLLSISDDVMLDVKHDVDILRKTMSEFEYRFQKYISEVV